MVQVWPLEGGRPRAGQAHRQSARLPASSRHAAGEEGSSVNPMVRADHLVPPAPTVPWIVLEPVLRPPGKTEMSTGSGMGLAAPRPPGPFTYLPTLSCPSGGLCVCGSPPGVTRTLARERGAPGPIVSPAGVCSLVCLLSAGSQARLRHILGTEALSPPDGGGWSPGQGGGPSGEAMVAGQRLERRELHTPSAGLKSSLGADPLV